MKPDPRTEPPLTIQLTAPELALLVCLLRRLENAETRAATLAKQRGALRQALARCQSAIRACELGARLDRVRRKGHAVLLLLAMILTGQSAFADYVEPVRKAKPAVVEIDVVTDEGFSSGTGFFISSDGYLVTNEHVLAGARRKSDVTVTGIDGTPYVLSGRAYRNDDEDISILKCDCPAGYQFSFLTLDPYDDVAEGQIVLVIGNPELFQGSVSNGLVAAIRKDQIQITAAISHGSSGSPVLNEAGMVIGVASQTHEEGQNLNFAVPAKAIFKGLATIQGYKSGEGNERVASAEPNNRTSGTRGTLIVPPPSESPVTTQEEAELALSDAYQTLLNIFDPQSGQLLRQEELSWLKQRERFKNDAPKFFQTTMARIYLLRTSWLMNRSE